MVLYRRNRVAGGSFFFTVAVADRRSTVLTDHVGHLRQAFRQTRIEYPFIIDAIVILPDHLHTIWSLPEGDDDYPGRWRRLKSLFTRALVKSGAPVLRDQRGEYALWQRRFWEHTIRDDNDFERCADYVHFNPVKHGYVGAPSQWAHTSLHRYVRAGVLPDDWGGSGHSVGGDFGEPMV